MTHKKIGRRAFLSMTGGTLLGIAGLEEYLSQIEPAWLDVTSHSLRLPHLERAFQGYRIAHITDIHADNTWMDKDRLMEIVQLVNQQQVDLAVITGDFVTMVNAKTTHTLSALRYLSARDGVLAVLGNHDHSTHPETVRMLLQESGIQELRNSFLTLSRGKTQFHIVGLDDLMRDDPQPSVWSYAGLLQGILAQFPAQGAVLLLVHEPDFADVAAASRRIDLQLSGHSHGGQIRIPFYGALVAPPLGEKYSDGLYVVGDMLHYTNRGVGMTGLPVRFNCRPEIAVFTLFSSQ